MKSILHTLCFFASFTTWSQPASEIYLLDVQLGRNKISVSNPVNITQHAGYDNQPSFHTSRPLVYYSSFNQEGRSDIKIYDYKTGKTIHLTNTQEREYSPTLTPDGNFISCIIQRDNNAQDLGKYPVNGGEATTLIDNLIVGYHAWVDESNLILFVLGEPPTLRWYNLADKSDMVLVEDPGRLLHRIPGTKAMSFVHKISENEWKIKKMEGPTRKMSDIVSTLPGREDMAWTSDGRIMMSDGDRLFFYDPYRRDGWKEVEGSASLNLRGITRLAISSDGTKMAVVAAE